LTGRYSITKNGYFNVLLIEFRDSLRPKRWIIPFSFSCYNHSDRRKIVHKLFDCPSFGWKVTWLQTKNTQKMALGELDESSSYLTTFLAHYGCYRWLRMPLRISSMPEVSSKGLTNVWMAFIL
jgi:hypothetical protein